MKNVNDLIRRQDRILRESEDSTVRSLLEILGQSYFALEEDLLRRWPGFSREAMPNLLPDQRKLLLLDQLKDLLPLIDSMAFSGIEAEFRDILAIADLNGITLGEELIRLRSGNDFVKQTASLPLEQVVIGAKSTAERMKAAGYRFSNEASTIVGMGITQGWSGRKTATALRKRFGIAKQYAEAEARTAINQAGNEASKRVYADNGIKYGQWNATNDDRVCPYCLARNMRVYRLEDIVIPSHYNDRCKIVPWSKRWQKAGLTDDDFAKQFRSDAIAQFNGKPNYGATPFERRAGTSTPKAVWSP